MEDDESCRRRDLKRERYVDARADGIYCKARLEDAKLCLVVLMGATTTLAQWASSWPISFGSQFRQWSPGG